ncbi:branched-chain amino acid ABC transporter ATP-binding protein/permease [Variovorax sp. LT1R16]|uniref:branched-chain amino acid ABC transporter ATP-binding protein/permease n=1 Tax=Variovorax sp. LT1R16 TaxID=3443728 RepID=UPI003F451023
MTKTAPLAIPCRKEKRRARLSIGRVGAITFAILVFALPLLPIPEFLITQMNYIGIDALVVLGIVLLTGVVGLTSFGQAAFAGIGAYTTAYLCLKMGASPWVGLLAGLLLTGAVSVVLGWVTLRMSGHNLPLATIAWCIALYYVIGNLDALGKYDGLNNVPPIMIGTHSLQSGRDFYYLIWTIALAAALGMHHLLESRTGRILKAMNPDRGGGQTMPSSVGASTFRYKLVVFVIAALLASVSGWLFAHMQRAVTPSPFGIGRSLDFLFMAVLGGVGHIWGAFLGAGFSTVLKDALQDWMPAIFGAGASFEGVIFGLLLIIVLKVAPQGLWSLVGRVIKRSSRPVDWQDAGSLKARKKTPKGERLLEAIGIRKQFGGLTAVHDIDFAVNGGEIVGLIGPNGAGKSTTFNLISGVLPLTSGEVRVSGDRVDGKPSRYIAAQGLSRTFQHVKLVPDMTVLENVAIGCYLRTSSSILGSIFRLDRAEERRALKEAEAQIRRIGLGGSMFELAGNLSLGSQRLVEIARALASDPTLLLLDEPAAGLRHGEKQALSKVLSQLRAEGLSLLLVEHDMEFVMNLTDRIVVMEFGRKLIEGTPQEVQDSPLVRAAYIGTEH